MRNQRFLDRQFADRKLSVVWGKPTPQGWNRMSRLRSLTGQVPGVAILADEGLGLRYRKPLTKSGAHMENRGRLVLASYPTPRTQVLIVTVYLPSGGTAETVKDRQGCLEEVLEEVSAYGNIPIALIGDWNLEPSENSLVPLLMSMKWGFPLTVSQDNSVLEKIGTYESPSGSTYIDYGLVSGSLPVLRQSVVETGAQHSAVWLDLPSSTPPSRHAEVPKAVSYGPYINPVPKLDARRSPFEEDQDMDSMWNHFLDDLHGYLASCAKRPPQKRPGNPIFAMTHRGNARLTDEGGETEQAIVAFRFAQRIREYVKQPSAPLLRKVYADKNACKLLSSIALPPCISSVQQQQHLQHMHALRTAAEQAREHAKTYMSELVSKRVKKWKASLTDRLQNPSSQLYRWLKQEGPAGPIVLCQDDVVLHDIQDVLSAHRQYWEQICCHPSPGDERLYLERFVQSQRGPNPDLFSGEEMLAVAKSLKTRCAAGLDCWSNESLKMMDAQCSTNLATVFNRVLRDGQWPRATLAARVSLIPKAGAPSERPSSWRPITITSTFYRLFAKACLWRCIQIVLPYLPSELLGGIPNRSSQRAVIRVYLWIEKIICTGAGSLYGVSLDASKCFDRVSLSDAIRAGLSCGVMPQVLAPIASFYLGHERHTSVRHYLDRNSWNISRGLIQGCSISVLLCCCVMRSWHEAVGPEICAYSFVDDRLLLSAEQQQLLVSWQASEEWDHSHQWSLNQDKSIHVCVGPPMGDLTWNSKVLPKGSQFTWLGHEFFTRYNSARTVWPKRLAAAQDSLRKLATLQVTPIVKQKVVERAVSPMFAYGVHSSLPPVNQIKGLTSSIRQAVWGFHKKRYHSWPMACAVLYRAHCVDVKSALIYNHVTLMCDALSEDSTWNLFRDLIETPRRVRPRGPAQVLEQILSEIGGVITPEKKLELGRFGNCAISEKKTLNHNLRQCLSHRLIAMASSRRKNMDLRGHTVDIRMSTQLYRQQHLKHRSGLVTLLTDGAITQERLHHMGEGLSDVCSFCGRCREGIRHVLWECEKWSHVRFLGESELLLIADLPPAAVLCGLALESFTSEQQKIWPRVQGQCSAVLELHQAQLCKPHSQSATAPVQVTQPLLNAPCEIPAPVSERQWALGSPLDVSCNSNLSSSRMPWMYSRSQYNRMCHWLAGLRVAPRSEMVPRLSILELYVSYLLANGSRRFSSGLTDNVNGAWWTTQLAQFARGVRSAQGLVLGAALLPPTDKGAERLDFVRRWHVPPQVAVIRVGLMLPRHQEVRDFLDNWCLMPAGQSHSSTSGAELWRRQTISIEHSQLEDSGSLSPRSLGWDWACTIRRARWHQKSAVAPWMTSFYQMRSWVAKVTDRLAAHNLSHVVDVMAVEGVGDVRDISMCAGKKTKKAKLLSAIADDNDKAAGSSNHIGQGGGLRLQCALCEQCAPLSHSRVWFRKQCTSDRGGRGRVIMEVNKSMRALAGQLEEEAAALRTAARVLA